MAEADDETGLSVGERLRAAREAQGISIEEVAARTRIPTRHLVSIEESDWERMPAQTYSLGFAKSYATAIGLDRIEIGEALRAEMGGRRSHSSTVEAFEPADPGRVPPKWLVIAALIAALLLVGGLLWLRQRSLGSPDTAGPAAQVAAPAATEAATGPPAPAASGPVVITANEPAWIKVRERGGATLFERELGAGQSYEVPASAIAPQLTTGRPEAIRISVGTADAPPVGPAGQTVSNISLLGPDLLRGGAAATAPAITAEPFTAR